MQCVLALTVILIQSRCVSDVLIDFPEEEPKMVVVSHFTPGEPLRVSLRVSKGLKDTVMDIQSLANVEMTVTNDSSLDADRFILKDGPLSYWQSTEIVAVDRKYRLKVKADGFPTVTAEGYAPAPSRLEPIQLDHTTWTEVSIENGKRKTLRIPLKLTVAKLPATKRYFAFKISHQLNDIDGNPSSAETASQFLADGRTVASLHDIPESVVLVNENFWTDSPDGRTLSLDALIPYDPQEEMPSKLLIEWRTVSEEFYRYHLSLSRQGNPALPFNDPDAVFSNINGGYGNFSGYSSVYYEVSL